MSTVAESLVRTLVEAKVKRIYGIVGDSLNGIIDALRRQKSIEWIHVRHEEVAAFAAGADAHITGELAVCAGSCGPGNLHLINGLFDCHRNGVPVLAIAAQIPSIEIGSGYFQETHPESIFKDCSYSCQLISTPEQMPRAIETAITACPGRQVISLSGHGGFTMLMGDVLTLVQMELPVKVVVCRARRGNHIQARSRLRPETCRYKSIHSIAALCARVSKTALNHSAALPAIKESQEMSVIQDTEIKDGQYEPGELPGNGKWRVESDSLGQVRMPADRLWGAQTQRSLIHFSIGDDLMPKAVYYAYGFVKKAAAIVNQRSGRLSRDIAEFIIRVADEVIAGKLDEEFLLYV